MDFKKIQDLVKLVNRTQISELKLEEKEFKISIRTKAYTEALQKGRVDVAPPAVVAAPVSESAPPPPSSHPTTGGPTSTELNGAQQEQAVGDNLITVKSPMIGTFYRSSAPEKPPFVKVGDSVQKGDVLCIIEAMKLFNEIESEVSGKVIKVVTDDASPVEYDQPIFIIEPA